jgi:hypothetical protein
MSVTDPVGLFIRELYYLGRALSVAAVILLAATVVPGWAIGPTFDCSKVTTPLARFICASPDLSQTDLEFVQPYYALRQQVGPAGWQALKVEAVDFQSRIAHQCGIAPSGALPPDPAALTGCLRQGICCPAVRLDVAPQRRRTERGQTADRSARGVDRSAGVGLPPSGSDHRWDIRGRCAVRRARLAAISEHARHRTAR